MTHNPLIWIGLAGIDPSDNARARWWEERLHWAMVAIALLAVPAYLLDTSEQFPGFHAFAVVLDGIIFVAFALETAWMMHVSDRPGHYLADNWLNVAILAGSAASMLGASTEWIALVRLARVAIVGLVILRAFAQFRVLFTRHGAPKLVGVTVFILIVSGALLYWLEPTVTTLWDGVWLAFVTATTIGYGDYVATTAGARLVAIFVALIGFAIVAVFTANVVAYFVGRDAPDAHRELHDDIVRLRADIAQLLRDGERARSESPAAELEALRRDVADLSARLAALSEQLRVANAVDATASGKAQQRPTGTDPR
jgi:voltage-gated potassium channel